ncbi:PDZ domain-containing protein [Tautonia sp. JC769]|uniref:PDZ domain-containing protein n=1 Tax=Tautonia sp. JC769 TaxID=3232135 RepID=UPI0034577B23
MFYRPLQSLATLAVISGIVLAGGANTAQAQIPQQFLNQFKKQIGPFVGVGQPPAPQPPPQQPPVQLPPAPQPAPAYIQPAPPPSNGYTLGVYTQVVPVPSFGAPGGGPALAYVNPGQGGGPSQYGLMITSLTPGGAAHRAGLEVGDIIVSANGQPTPNVDWLRWMLNNSNGYVNLTVRNVRPPHNFVQVPVSLVGVGFPIGQPAAAAYGQ